MSDKGKAWKELMKEELLRWLMNMFLANPPLPIRRWLPIDKRAYQQICQIIQQKHKELKRDKSLDDIYIKLLEDSIKHGVGEKKFIERILKKFKQILEEENKNETKTKLTW